MPNAQTGRAYQYQYQVFILIPGIYLDPWGAQSSVLVSLASELEKNDP